MDRPSSPRVSGREAPHRQCPTHQNATRSVRRRISPACMMEMPRGGSRRPISCPASRQHLPVGHAVVRCCPSRVRRAVDGGKANDQRSTPELPGDNRRAPCRGPMRSREGARARVRARRPVHARKHVAATTAPRAAYQRQKNCQTPRLPASGSAGVDPGRPLSNGRWFTGSGVSRALSLGSTCGCP